MPPAGIRRLYHGSGQQDTASALVPLHTVKRLSTPFPSSAQGRSACVLPGKTQLPSSCMRWLTMGCPGSFSLPM
ncbi:hypothetical protein QYF36_016944 [Acer negundo]|nr:hypothetical protein QYF36_016944 [Acer negundo]